MRERFEERCKLYNADFTLTTPVGSTCDVIGLRVDLVAKTVSLTDAFVEKFREVAGCIPQFFGRFQKPSHRVLWQLFGSMMWGCRVLGVGVGLCYFPNLFSWLSSRARQLGESPGLWERPCTIWPTALADLQRMADKLLANAPRQVHEHIPPQHELWTDASSTGYGAVHASELFSQTASGRFGPKMMPKGIALKELYAVLKGLTEVRKRLPHVQEVGLRCDNENVCAWLRKRKANSHEANSMLRKILDLRFKLDVQWVPSAENLADEPSRRR